MSKRPALCACRKIGIYFIIDNFFPISHFQHVLSQCRHIHLHNVCPDLCPVLGIHVEHGVGYLVVYRLLVSGHKCTNDIELLLELIKYLRQGAFLLRQQINAGRLPEGFICGSRKVKPAPVALVHALILLSIPALEFVHSEHLASVYRRFIMLLKTKKRISHSFLGIKKKVHNTFSY